MMFIVNLCIAGICLITVGYLVYRRRSDSRTASEYVEAGRVLHPRVMILSSGVTFIGTTVVIGFGGATAVFGFSLLWLGFLNIIIGVFIAFVFFGRRTRRMGLALHAYTFPEILGERYRSPFIQGFAGMIIFVFIPLYAAAILIGLSRLIEVSLHIPYVLGLLAFSLFLAFYVVTGGFTAAIYTEAFQGVVMIVVMTILGVSTYYFLDGVVPAHQALTDIAAMVPEQWAREGHLGWTAGPRLWSPFWWIVYSSIIYGVGIGVVAQPQLVTRFLMTPSDRVLHRSLLVGGIYILAMSGVSLTIGPLTNAVFVQRFEEITIAMAGGNVDAIIPLYVDTIMPWWFGPLFLVGMMAASMATLSAQFHIGGTSLGRDFYGKAMGFGRTGEIFFTRLGIVLTLGAAIIWGLALPPSIIVVVVVFFFGLCASSFLPSYFLGLYWQGVSKAGAMVSMIGGFCMSFLWMIFFHYQGSTVLGICRALFGSVNLVANYPPTSWLWQLQYIDPVIIALPVSFALCIGVSRVTSKMPTDHLKRCFKYIK